MVCELEPLAKQDLWDAQAKLGMTNEQIAAALEITSNSWRLMKRGKSRITLRTTRLIHELLAARGLSL